MVADSDSACKEDNFQQLACTGDTANSVDVIRVYA